MSFDVTVMSDVSGLTAVYSRFFLALRTRACRWLTFELLASLEQLAVGTCWQRFGLSGFDPLRLNSACFLPYSRSTCAFLVWVLSAEFFYHRNAASSRATSRQLSCSCSYLSGLSSRCLEVGYCCGREGPCAALRRDYPCEPLLCSISPSVT